MSRNSGLAILQKTYDDSYLKCSTAVYYESKGSEDEAMRCWRNALNEILEHRANDILPSYIPRTETERALVDSLRQLELQCKERIDLLEALRISRQDRSVPPSPMPSGSKSTESNNLPTSSHENGWIGHGTVPATQYTELARPALPARPSLPGRTSSENAVVGRGTSQPSSTMNQHPPTLPAISPNPLAMPRHGDTSYRSPSPEKHTMRTTLRSGRSGEKTTKLSRKPARAEGPGANKAATLAWSALASRDRFLRGFSTNSESSTTQSVPPMTPDDSKLRPGSSPLQWDMHTRRLMVPRESTVSAADVSRGERHSDDFTYTRPSPLSINAASSAIKSRSSQDIPSSDPSTPKQERNSRPRPPQSVPPPRAQRLEAPAHPDTSDVEGRRRNYSDGPDRRKVVGESSLHSNTHHGGTPETRKAQRRPKHTFQQSSTQSEVSSPSDVEPLSRTTPKPKTRKRQQQNQKKDEAVVADAQASSDNDNETDDTSDAKTAWKKRQKTILKNLPSGVDESAAKQILNDIVVQGDEVRWGDVAGLEIAKTALREAVVYPFLRPDLFMGLREPARGMLLFGPPGTGKTMLARAVATESRSTFFSISASSLTSKYLGESEKLVRALFLLAKELAPSIIFVDEIDSLLSQRSGSGEHEATRRIKTEFLIQWSDLQRAAAGRIVDENDKNRGDANRVLVLAATNLPWAIDEAARRRFVRRQYIPLPETETRTTQLKTLLGQQKHSLSNTDIDKLVLLTEGFSGSDITALAKDAAMGPLRSLGEALLHMTMDQIRPIHLEDFEASLTTIRPSVSKAGLKEYEDWAKEFGERGG